VRRADRFGAGRHLLSSAAGDLRHGTHCACVLRCLARLWVVQNAARRTVAVRVAAARRGVRCGSVQQCVHPAEGLGVVGCCAGRTVLEQRDGVAEQSLSAVSQR
jgi:hypothetical protein